VSIDGLDNLRRWRDRSRGRPAVERAIAVPVAVEPADMLETAKTIVTR